MEDKHVRLRMLHEILPVFEKATKIKGEQMYTDTAVRGMTGIAIASDKIFEKDGKHSTMLNIEGKNIQLNLKWKPKWIKK